MLRNLHVVVIATLVIGSRSHNPGPEETAQSVKHLLCNGKDVSQIPGTHKNWTWGHQHQAQ